MNDRLEDELVEWLRERGMPDPVAMSDVTAGLDRLPDRQPRRSGWIRAATAAVLVIAGIGAAVVVPQLVDPSVGPAKLVLPDPAAFANDPRLQVCGAGSDGLLTAFEMAHVSDYQRHLPNAYPLVGLGVDPAAPALVLVYAGPSTGGRLPLPASPTPSPSPSEHDLCMVVGDEPSAWAPIAIARVDISGLIAVLPSPAPTLAPAELGPTPEPDPNWAGDLFGQLECLGEPQPIGGELGAISPVGQGGTASPYPWLYALDDEDLPLEGWVESPQSGWETGRSRFARYINETDERVVAVIVMGAGFGEWAVVAYRACLPAEFDPLRGRTTDDAPWLDAHGTSSAKVRSIAGPAHCGWESTVWLFLDDRLYLRDPTGIFKDVEVGAYLADTELPSDARDTGLSSHDHLLFTTSDGDAVFVQTPAGVERWPRSTDAFLGCA